MFALSLASTMTPPPIQRNPIDTNQRSKKHKLKLRHVTDPTLQTLRELTARSPSTSPWGHLARHLTLQALALLSSLTGTPAGVVSILDSLLPHCNLVSTNALDLDQACDVVQLQFLGCLADFVSACSEDHVTSTSTHHVPTTPQDILQVLANARYDYQTGSCYNVAVSGSVWDPVVEQGERIVSEWVSMPTDASPSGVVTDEEKRRRREIFDELAEQLSDLMMNEYPRLWRRLNDYVDEISFAVAVPLPTSVNASRKGSTVSPPGAAGTATSGVRLPSSSPTPTSSSAASTSASALHLRHLYGTLQPRPPPVISPAQPAGLDPPPSPIKAANDDSTPLCEPSPHVPPSPTPTSESKPLTATQRQHALERILTEYDTHRVSTPGSPLRRSSAASAATNPLPFRVHPDRHFPAAARARVLATTRSADLDAYQAYAATQPLPSRTVVHASPWIPPAFSAPIPAMSDTPPAPARPRAVAASLKYGGNWTVPPARRALAIRERERQEATGVSLGYRLTPRGGERNAQVRSKVDELAQHVAAVSVEMAAEARALQGGPSSGGARERAGSDAGRGGEGGQAKVNGGKKGSKGPPGGRR